VDVGALRLLSAGEQGRVVFLKLVKALLSGSGDEPLHGVLLLSRAPAQLVVAEFATTVASCVDHPDYAVSVIVERLAQRWDVTAPMARRELPGFYQLALPEDDSDFEPPTVDPDSGAMRVEDPMGWTTDLGFMIQPLARDRVTVALIRRRCAMFISKWGGLEEFGHTATERLRARLGQLRMRLPYARPHMVAAVRAIRYVAGEMRRSGLLRQNEHARFLHIFGCPPDNLPVLVPIPRPDFERRPTITRSHRDETAWVDGIEHDDPTSENQLLFAEFTRFRRQYIWRQFTLERLTVPSSEPIKGLNAAEWIHSVPRAKWIEQVAPSSQERSRVLIRNLHLHSGVEVPSGVLVICPIWLRQLRWAPHPENWLIYQNSSGRTAARISWWRDGGPVDLQDESYWGEGVAIVLTPEGRRELEAEVGTLFRSAIARRAVSQRAGGEEPLERIKRWLA
jgi:hypothetical protein